MKARPLARMAACLLMAATVAAREALPDKAAGVTRPRVALALSGGGARGIAHIGALRALEEAGIPVDAIAANSMGAVVGGIYATGRTAHDLEAVVRSPGWASLFSGRPDRRALPVAHRVDRHGPTTGVNFDWQTVRLQGGLLDDHRVNSFLIEQLSPAGYAAGGDFDRLAIPFRAVAGDLGNGDPVVLAKGDLALAVRASMAIPLVFDPIEWEGRTLVDGLIVDNLPIDVARTFGAAVVVAIDTGSPAYNPKDYRSSFGAAAQVIDVLARRRYQDFSAEADVLVRPDLGNRSVADYRGLDDLIQRGYEAMKACLPAIRARLEAAGIADLAPRPRTAVGPSLEGAQIAAVRVQGNRRVSDALVRRVFDIPIGPGYIMGRGLNAFDKIDASELFDWTWQSFEPTAEGVAIVLHVKEAAPNRAEIGLGYSEWEKARGSIRLRNQNTLGFGEQLELLLASSDAETIFQASIRGARLFVTGLGYRVAAYFERGKPRFFTGEGDEINRGRFERAGVDLALRTSLERWGLVEAGVRFGRVQTLPRAGLDFPEAVDRVGALFGSVRIDTLDDLAWPRSGCRLVLGGEWNIEGLGAELPYWRSQAEGRIGRRLGRRWVAQVDGFAGFSGGDLPVYERHWLGGTVLLPGYRHEELKGGQALAAALSLRYRITGELQILARGGAGNVFARTDDITFDGLRWGAAIGLYHPSPIGPVSLETGIRRTGEVVTTLTVGWN